MLLKPILKQPLKPNFTQKEQNDRYQNQDRSGYNNNSSRKQSQDTILSRGLIPFSNIQKKNNNIDYSQINSYTLHGQQSLRKRPSNTQVFNKGKEIAANSKFNELNQFQSNFHQKDKKLELTQDQKFDQIIQVAQNSQNKQKKPVLYSNSLRLYNSILPRMLFSKVNQNYCKIQKYKFYDISNKIIHQAKTSTYRYPKQVEEIISKYNEWKQKKIKQSVSQKQNKMDQEKSSKIEPNKQEHYQKIPYHPRFGTNSDIFWCFNEEIVILWRYRSEDFTMPEILTKMNFKHEEQPISAVCADYVNNKVLRKDKTILISIGFIDKLKMFAFLQEEWKKDRQQNMYYFTSQNYQNKYFRDLMLLLKTEFLITSITMKNISNSHGERSIIILTDDGQEIQVLDLNNSFSHRSQDPYNIKKKLQKKFAFSGVQTQKSLEKLLHFQDSTDQLKNYCITFTKKIHTTLNRYFGNSFKQKLKNFFKPKKQYYSQEIISIFQWNDLAMNDITFWKKIRKPAQITKINSIDSHFLVDKLKSCFNQFFKFNNDTDMAIADIQIVDPDNTDFLNHKKTNLLKVYFTNGTFIKIQNLKMINFQGKIEPCPSISSEFSTIGQNYLEYLQLLDKKKNFLLSEKQLKNKKNNLNRKNFLFQLNDSQNAKNPKARKIDPVLKAHQELLITKNNVLINNKNHVNYLLMESIKTQQKQSFVQDNLIIQKLQSSFDGPIKYILMRKNHLLQIKTQNPVHHLIMLYHIMKNYPETKTSVQKMIKNHFQIDYSTKISLIHNLFTLIMKIQTLGMKRESSSLQYPSKNMSYDLKMAFEKKSYSKFFGQMQLTQQLILINYIVFDQYVYKINVETKPYKNLIQALISEKDFEKQKLEDRINQKQSSLLMQPNFYEIYVNQGIYDQLWNLLFQQGLKLNVQSSSIIENFKQSDDFSEVTLEKNPISNICYALTIYLSQLLNPIFNINYLKLPQIRKEQVKVVQKIQQFQKFLVKLLKQCNQRTSVTNDTNLIINQLKFGLFRTKILLKLLDILGQENMRIQDYRYEKVQITLKEATFNPQCLTYCGKLAVKYLFQDNNHMLDEIQNAFPELELKFKRFYQGWKKMNKTIIQKKIIPFKIAEEKVPNYNFKVDEAQQFQSRQRQLYIMSNVLTPQNFEQMQTYYFNKRNVQTFVQIVFRRIGCIKGTLIALNDKIQYSNSSSQFSKNFIQKKGFQSYLASRTKGWLKFEETSFMKVQFQQYEILQQKFNQKIISFINMIFDLYIRQEENYRKNLEQRIKQKKKWQIFVKSEPQVDQSYFIDVWANQLIQTIKVILNKGNDYFKIQLYKKLTSSLCLSRFFVRSDYQRVLNNYSLETIFSKQPKQIYKKIQSKQLNQIAKAESGSNHQVKQIFCNQIKKQRFPFLPVSKKSIDWAEKMVQQNRLFGTTSNIKQQRSVNK